MFDTLSLASLPAADEAIRPAIRALAAEAASSAGADRRVRSWQGYDPAFSRRLGEAGFLGLTLPKRYGGHERGPFARFVVNGADMAGHPLRADPRPVSGVVHSAHALARMATGLTRWANEPDAPDEVLHRRDVAVRDLSEALDTLAGKAEWTAAGEKYFAALRACEKALQPERRLQDGPGGRPVSDQKNRPLSANRR